MDCGAASAATITGTGTLTLGGNISVTSAGTGSTGATISCPVALGANRTFTIGYDGTAANDLTISGVISGAFTLTKNGAGTLELSGANTYTGLTTISVGTLRLGNAAALGTNAAGTTITNGSVLDLNGTNYTTTEALTLNGTGISGGGALINSSSTGATYSGLLTLGSASSIVGETGTINISHTGTITGATFGLTLGGAQGGTIASIIGTTSGTLTKAGSGTWTLSGANTYTGVTRINEGVLSVGTINNGGIAGNLGQATNAAANLVLGGGTLRYTGATSSTNRAYTLTASTTSAIEVTNPNTTLTISGAGANTTGVLTKTSDGVLILSAANAYTGLTTISGGTLRHGRVDALSSGSVMVNGGTWDVATFNDAVGAVTLTDGSIIGTTGVITGTSYSVEQGTINAILAGNGVNLTKTDSGTVTLSSNNTYTGTTTISGGILQISAADRIANTSNLILNGGTFSSGASTGFNETMGTLTLSENSTIALGTGVHSINLAASDKTTWTADKTITITGWTGTTGCSGTAGRIFVGSDATGLTNAQLAAFRFSGYENGAVILATGEVVPPITDVSNVLATNMTEGIKVSWSNPACFDEVMVVVKAAGAITFVPDGNGSKYSGIDSVFGNNNSKYDDVYLVFKGNRNFVTITGLSYGTVYYFKIFTRTGSVWSAGEETSIRYMSPGLQITKLGAQGSRSIDFDNTEDGANNGAFNGSGFAPEPATGQLSSNTFHIHLDKDSVINFGESRGSGLFARGSSAGGVSNHGVYAFNVGNSTTPNYALGLQAVKSNNPEMISVRAVNATDSAVNFIMVEYDVYILNNTNEQLGVSMAHANTNEDNKFAKENNMWIASVKDAASSPEWACYTRKFWLALASPLPIGAPYYFRWTLEPGGNTDQDVVAFDNIKVCMCTTRPSEGSVPDTIRPGKRVSLVLQGGTNVLEGALEVDTLNLGGSKIKLKGGTLVLNDSIMGASDTSYIVLEDSNAVVHKNQNKAGKIEFPVGTEEKYTPISLDFTKGKFSDSSFVEISIQDTLHPQLSASTANYIKRFWAIDQKNVDSFNCTIVCKYEQSDVIGDESKIVTGKYSKGVWTVGSPADTLNNLLIYENAGSFSDVTGGPIEAVPVTWLTFKGKMLEESNLLEWSTAQEINNSHFVIERSAGDGHFEVIGETPGRGTISAISTYQFEDKEPLSTSVYRLKQVDYDGAFEYSRLIVVVRNRPGIAEGVRLFPNPTTGVITILREKDFQGSTPVTIYDQMGRECLHFESVYSGDELNISALKQGIYWLETTDLRGMPVRKCVIRE